MSHVRVTLHSTNTANKPYRYNDVEEFMAEGDLWELDATIATESANNGVR